MKDLLCFERKAWSQGASRICGIDEVGRGPLAGPVVAVAVILPREFTHRTLNDSKQLSEKAREEIYLELTANRDVYWGVALIDSDEIDRINILKATWKAMVAARNQLNPPPDWTLVDGNFVPLLGKAQTSIVDGDTLSLSIAAASVLAKVTRDRIMEKLHEQFPDYNFDKNKGYGTAYHLEALLKVGPCPAHRRSFDPVFNCINKPWFV